jgi:hypothetical protein
MAEKLRCERCDADNQADARFCIDCGAALSPPATGPTARLAESECPNCRANNATGAQFCAVCGHSLDTEATPRSRPTPAHLTPAPPVVQPNYPRESIRHRQGEEIMYCPVCREITLVMADRQGIESKN